MRTNLGLVSLEIIIRQDIYTTQLLLKKTCDWGNMTTNSGLTPSEIIITQNIYPMRSDE